MRAVLFFLIILFSVSCADKKQEYLLLGFEKDLIPEGIAIDARSQTLFLNSLKHQKIVQCSIDGTNARDFITSSQHSYLSGFGMTVKGDTLYALGNSLPKHNSRSILLLLNTKTGGLIKSYSPVDTGFKYLNDLAVCSNGDIFITDSESDKIYTIQQNKQVLQVYLDDPAIGGSNGIAISDDEKYLYLASYKTGIRVVDRSTKKVINEANLDNRGIDGMKFYKNSLIAIVNAKQLKDENGVYRYFLNTEKTAITGSEKILSFEKNFQIPTTFAIMNDHIFFTINSQLDNLDSESGRIIDSSRLQPYRLLKLKLDIGY